VVAARERGLPGNHHSPLNDHGHTKTGACHQTDTFWAGMRGFLEMGILPDYEEILHAMTVDYASRAIAQIGKAGILAGTGLPCMEHALHSDQRNFRLVRSFGI